METKEFSVEKFVKSANYLKHKDMLKKLASDVLEKLGADKSDIEISNYSKQNNSSETGPGGKYQIYDYREGFTIGANKMGFRIVIEEKMHEAYDIAWKGIIRYNSFNLPDNFSINIDLVDRSKLNISAKLPVTIIDFLNKSLLEIE